MTFEIEKNGNETKSGIYPWNIFKCGTIFRWSINIQNINIRKTSFLFLLKKNKLKKKNH